ncbi:MAG: hypothetical protein RSA84_23470 [Acinetobacter sp.]
MLFLHAKKEGEILADISKELQAFKDARLGKEVRGSMISLAEKVNADGEKALTDVATTLVMVNAAVTKADTAAGGADASAKKANDAASNADTVRTSTELLRQDLQQKLTAGYWKGDKGDKGDTGIQGLSGVSAPSAGMFTLALDPATGNLYAEYPDGSTPPAFEYDNVTGNLYYVI